MFFSKTFAVAVAAFFVQSTLAADCARKYTVKEGDICDSISAANQVSTYQLAVVNHGLVDEGCSNLAPGQEICLGYPSEDCSTTYVVQDNDTCDGINSAHSLNSTILYLNNPQINQACDNIYIGEVLCVAQNVQVPPAPAGAIPATAIPATATPAVPSAIKTPAGAQPPFL
ncbi:carbohydrate-binding module family 50 protein [Macrolepiota fuliginosa MF-IS2]|uniref:Carbohydrate-binding module family 50 protein n=1 Tax=Macrolepiota fuliginosa MF-IS2 TaxID=1400762 RepID=A0A9P5XJB5_9AGAR|nr:carbohydrate-binding module family 50 protein [Macrolepiota fuliginosa MF-IS2]